MGAIRLLMMQGSHKAILHAPIVFVFNVEDRLLVLDVLRQLRMSAASVRIEFGDFQIEPVATHKEGICDVIDLGNDPFDQTTSVIRNVACRVSQSPPNAVHNAN